MNTAIAGQKSPAAVTAGALNEIKVKCSPDQAAYFHQLADENESEPGELILALACDRLTSPPNCLTEDKHNEVPALLWCYARSGEVPEADAGWEFCTEAPRTAQVDECRTSKVMVELSSERMAQIRALIAKLEIPESMIPEVVGRVGTDSELEDDEAFWTIYWTYPNRKAAARVAARIFEWRPLYEEFQLVFYRDGQSVIEAFKNSGYEKASKAFVAAQQTVEIKRTKKRAGTRSHV